MQEYVIHIKFEDRPGLGYEIFALCENHGIDKIAMEADPQYGMMIKFRCPPGILSQGLIDDLQQIPGVIAAGFREQMPSEERAHELATILNSVSEGIVAVDREGRITHINLVACKIFHTVEEQCLGEKADFLFNPDPPIFDTLQTGRPYNLLERKYKLRGHGVHILTSGVPILNEKKQIIGAVATIKEFQQIERMISKVDRNRQLAAFEDIVHQSPIMVRLVASAKTVAKGSSTILLRGESGTGKEIFATAIHREGSRQRAPFIAINCAALPDSLLESELFGYEEGAFTGAAKGGRQGLFEQADGGTLFLDEIGEISQQVQVSLLRALQEGTIRRVGGSSEIPVNVRIIAATHRNLEELTRSRQFREDLYYRLNVIPLVIPPLRERREDIPLIAQHLIRKISVKLNRAEIHLSRESIEFLMVQEWPGNVRQLENTLERIINLVDTHEITVQHLLEWTDFRHNGKKGTTRQLDQTATETDNLSFTFPDSPPYPPLKEVVQEVERQVLLKVLEKYPTSRQAGRLLGVSNTTILNKMKTCGIELP